MSEEQKIVAAKKVYDTLCATLDSMGWTYTKGNDDFSIKSVTRGDDLPIDFYIAADAERYTLMFISNLPFVVPEDKRMEIALAICMMNDSITTANISIVTENMSEKSEQTP